MSARALIFNSHGALRAPWRIVIFFVAAAAGVFLARNAVLPLLVAVFALAGLPLDTDFWSLVIGFGVAHWVAVRWIERRAASPAQGGEPAPASASRGITWGFIGLDRQAARPRTLAAGFALGGVAIGVPTLALLGTHWLTGKPTPAGSWGGAALRVSWFLLPAALWEELFSRGYVFAVLREVWGWRLTLLATSVVFGLMHLQNPGADVRSATLVAAAGIFLGAVLIATRSLYAAWMAHFAWNWTMAVLFHTAVSGFPMEAPNYRVVDNGPDWATGGSWGPEGGIPAMLGMGAGLVYLVARRRRRQES